MDKYRGSVYLAYINKLLKITKNITDIQNGFWFGSAHMVKACLIVIDWVSIRKVQITGDSV